MLFWSIAAGAAACFFLLSRAWSPPPVEHVMNKANFFHHQKSNDPNSIDGRIPIGYWQDEGPNSVEKFVDTNWDATERETVIQYLKLGSSSEETSNKNYPQVLQSWRGLAFCRLCEQAVGNSCNGDDKYNWPQGYVHYIEEHNIKPPQEFITHVQHQMKLLEK